MISVYGGLNLDEVFFNRCLCIGKLRVDTEKSYKGIVADIFRHRFRNIFDPMRIKRN